MHGGLSPARLGEFRQNVVLGLEQSSELVGERQNLICHYRPPNLIQQVGVFAEGVDEVFDCVYGYHDFLSA